VTPTAYYNSSKLCWEVWIEEAQGDRFEKVIKNLNVAHQILKEQGIKFLEALAENIKNDVLEESSLPATLNGLVVLDLMKVKQKHPEKLNESMSIRKYIKDDKSSDNTLVEQLGRLVNDHGENAQTLKEYYKTHSPSNKIKFTKGEVDKIKNLVKLTNVFHASKEFKISRTTINRILKENENNSSGLNEKQRLHLSFHTFEKYSFTQFDIGASETVCTLSLVVSLKAPLYGNRVRKTFKKHELKK
jgi:hypothetical protein